MAFCTNLPSIQKVSWVYNFLKVFIEEQNCFPICRKFVKKMNHDAAQRSKHATHFLQQLLCLILVSQFDIQCQVHGWREGNHAIIKDLIRWPPIIKSIAKK